MKKIIILIISFCILLLQQGFAQKDVCKDIPNPVDGKLVNDFYQAIGNNTESEIENLLRKYNDSTSIEIAVVTIKDIGLEYESAYADRIGNCWGVGKEKYDNGIVILVSFEGNRAWAIATGKGMNQYLTDYRASSIGQENLIPNLQSGKTDEAFTSTVNAIINHLGWKSWEMREYWSSWDNETTKIEKSYSKTATAQNLGGFFTWALYLGLLGYILWCIYTWNKEIEIRRKIKKQIHEWDEKMRDFPKNVEVKDWPRWAEDKLAFLQAKSKEHKINYEAYKLIILKMMKKCPKRAYENLSSLWGDYRCIVSKIPNSILKLIEEKELYEKEALSKVQSVKKLAEILLLQIGNKFIAKGFLFEDYLQEINTSKSTILAYENELSKEHPDKESFKEAYEAAISIDKKIGTLAYELESYVEKYNEISVNSKQLLDQVIKKLKTSEKEKYGILLKRMQKEHPENVWKDLQENFSTIDSTLVDATVEIQNSVKLNAILKPDSLKEAYALYAEGNALINSVISIYQSIDNTIDAQREAKGEYENLESSAKNAIENAVKKCNESHVKFESKSLKDEAEEKMRKAKSMLSSGIVDWVWLVALLTSVREIAERAYSQASSDISSYNSYHSHYSSSSSSHSSSSFGGFGGGSFGGSGAGGHW
jgi:uncharacterized membrane protein YgcG